MYRQLFIILFLSFFALSGCKKDMPEPPTQGNSNTSHWGTAYNQYDVTFFSTVNGSIITVSINGQSQQITYYYNYNPGCNAMGCANFTLPPGTYPYTAGGSSGTVVTGASQCITVLVN